MTLNKGDSLKGFSKQLQRIKNASGRKEKKKIIVKISEEYNWEGKIAIISGDYTNYGVGDSTAEQAIYIAYRNGNKLDVHRSWVEDELQKHGTYSEVLINNSEINHHNKSDSIGEMIDGLKSAKTKSGKELKYHLRRMLERYNKPWIIIFALLGDVSLGISHSSICNAVGAQNNYSTEEIKNGRAIYHDTCEFIARTIDGLELNELRHGRSFKPMKAKSKDIPEDDSNWVAQMKLDGYRCVIHVSDGDATAFTSSGNECTRLLPELGRVDWPSGDWIFDAEVVSDTRSYGDTKKRMQKDAVSYTSNTMNFWVFDMLYGGGDSLLDMPFHERVDNMFEVIPHDPRLIPLNAFDDIDMAREEAKREGFEGLIVKKKDHVYQPGRRSGDWRKDKMRDETLDLRVKDVIQGTGKNSDCMGSLKLETSDGVEMGNVGTGFGDKMRRRIWNRQDGIIGSIVEVSFDASDSYEDGLRFPAFEQFRNDKSSANSYARVKNVDPTA